MPPRCCDGLTAGDVVLLGPAPQPGSRVRVDTVGRRRAPAPANAQAGDDAGAALTNAMGR